MRLPQLVDPFECLRKKAVFEGTLTEPELSRLAPLLREPVRDVVFCIAFVQDGSGRCILECSVKACLKVTCERCAKEMELNVHTHSQLAVVLCDEQAKELPELYEPLLVDNGLIALLDVVEDELLLAMPMIPRHSFQCNALV